MRQAKSKTKLVIDAKHSRKTWMLLTIFSVIAPVSITPAYSSEVVSKVIFQKASYYIDLKGRGGRVDVLRTPTIEILHQDSYSCSWDEPDKNEFGSCPIELKIRYTDGSGKLPTYEYENFLLRPVYFVSGNTIYGEWEDLNLCYRGIKCGYTANASGSIPIESDGFLARIDNFKKFYGPSEMIIEWRGFEDRDCYKAPCPGSTNAAKVLTQSPSRIKLLGPTKSEALSIQAEKIKREEAEAEARYKAEVEEERRWEFGKYNDGIDSFVYLDQYADDDESIGMEETRTLRLFCNKRKLGVLIDIDFADGRGWQGSASVRFDSGSVKSMSYTLDRNFDAIYLNSPKVFTTSLVKSKKVRIKIRTATGNEILVFYTGNLAKYKKNFASRGCAFS